MNEFNHAKHTVALVAGPDSLSEPLSLLYAAQSFPNVAVRVYDERDWRVYIEHRDVLLLLNCTSLPFSDRLLIVFKVVAELLSLPSVS